MTCAKIKTPRNRKRKTVITTPCGAVVVVETGSHDGKPVVLVSAPVGSQIQIDNRTPSSLDSR